ncbi:hypothetical protein DW987_12295 [Ruminococcus sp. AM50-15BH]|nr:hypothetical protein DW987_12295 [Ruminococcus sp. AM50-15BH]RHR22288.1 hypothetical protein DWX46_16300 [Ruminococcus sp. AF19-29]RHU45932.1 hypothetical protein DXD14_13905 [Ruminococcus sp. TF11-2AC]
MLLSSLSHFFYDLLYFLIYIISVHKFPLLSGVRLRFCFTALFYFITDYIKSKENSLYYLCKNIYKKIRKQSGLVLNLSVF